MTGSQTEADEEYEYIHAIVECGELLCKYKISGNPISGSMEHDESVVDYSDDEIRDLTALMLDVPDSQKEKIEIIHE